MTEQERIDRQALLRRAAATAGALYVAPVLSSVARAEASTCTGQPCKANRKCKRLGGKGCECVNGRCRPKTSCERQDARCDSPSPCSAIQLCNESPVCICGPLAPYPFGGTDCVNFPSNFCSDYPPCDVSTGQGCPSGMCCIDVCCSTGICTPPCTA